MRKIDEQITRDHRRVRQLELGQVSSQTMKMNSELGSLERLQTLTQERGDQAGKHVSCATGGHAGIARLVHKDTSAVRDNGPMTFQNDDHIIFLRKLNGQLLAAGLDRGDITAEQAGEFSWMRGQDDGRLMTLQ